MLLTQTIPSPAAMTPRQLSQWRYDHPKQFLELPPDLQQFRKWERIDALSAASRAKFDALIEARHDEACAADNKRRDELFVEARQIAREHPQWLEALRELRRNVEYEIFKQIIDNDTYPVIVRGQTVRIDPVPQLDDEFVEWVAQCIEWDNKMNQLLIDVKLGRISLSNSVQKNVRSLSDFQCDAKGYPDSSNPDNVRVFLKTQNALLRWNEWFQRIEIRETSPWTTGRKEMDWAPLTDATIGRLMTLAGDTDYRFRPSEQLFRRATEAIARETVFDPIVEYLAEAEAKWDRMPRLAIWLSKACGTPCDPYHQAVGKNVIGGMVKRARQPGAKHDEVAILIGAQGTYKSTLCRALAWQDEFFTDSVSFDGSPQNLVPQLFGKWVVELGELDGMTSRETSFIKRFISAQADNVTLKYKAIATDYARRCVFIGTSNDDRVLRDATGNRRFLPVRIERQIDVAWVRENLDQLIGEAAAMQTAGATFEIPADIIPEARNHQEAARAGADFETFLEHWFAGEQPTLVAAADVAALLKEAVGRSVPANKYGATMKRLGFVDGTVRVGGKPTRSWRRGTGAVTVALHRNGNGHLVPVQRPSFTPTVVESLPLPGNL